jgi:virginiamycin B lyase
MTGAPVTGTATWQGNIAGTTVSFRPSYVVNNSVGANGKGNFPGVASVSLDVPSSLASGCATRRGVRSAIVTGTITMGPPCGPGDGSIAIYPISAGPVCGDIYNPGAITAGSDGALWFLNDTSVGRMTTSGAVTLYSGPNIHPASWESIAAGPDGALWFTNQPTLQTSTSLTGASVGRITTSGVVTVYPVDGEANGIVAGPDGALWFIESFLFTSGRPSLIGRITTSGAITTYAMPSSAGLNSNLIVGPDGNLWFAHANPIPSAGFIIPGTGFIGRITTAGVVTTYPDPSGGNPQSIASGPDGALWFTDDYYPSGSTAIGRITTSGVFTNFYSGSNIDAVGAIAAGPDGAMWFTDGSPYSPLLIPNEIGSIGRITTAGVVTNYTAPGVYDPTAITTGPDGALWFTNYGSDTVGRITIP